MQYQKTKIMASCPITSWQIEGKKWKQWQRLFSWAPKSLWTMITAWELDHKEGWAPKNWWFWTVVLEKTLESPLNFKEIKLVNPEGNQIWIFIRRTDAEAPTLWPSDTKSQLSGKDPDAEKHWQQEKGTTEDEMAGWHHRLDEQAPGSLACCSPWGCKE